MSDANPITWLTALTLIDPADDTELGSDEFYLAENLDFIVDGEVLRCPAGGRTDGGSIPPLVQGMTGAERWDRPGRLGYLVHDFAYKRELLTLVDNLEWKRREVTREWADELMHRIHTERGMSWLKRHRVYRGVRMFGWAAWANHGRKITPEKPVETGMKAHGDV